MAKNFLFPLVIGAVIFLGIFFFSVPGSGNRDGRILFKNKASFVYRGNNSPAYLLVKASLISDINNIIFPRQLDSNSSFFCSKANDFCIFCFNINNKGKGCVEDGSFTEELKTIVFDEDIWLFDGEKIKLVFSGRAANLLYNTYSFDLDESKNSEHDRLLCHTDMEKKTCDTELPMIFVKN